MKYQNQKPDLADQIKTLVQSANSVKTVPHGIKTVNPGEGLQLLSGDGAEIFWDWETAAEYDTRISEGRAAIEQARADLDQAEADLAAGAARLDENERILDALGPRVDAAESTVAQASRDLDALETTVGDVQAKAAASEQKATEALAKAGAAQVSADGKTTITRATSPASQPGKAVGDTHFTMSSMGGGGVVTRQQRWDGSTWQDESLSHHVIASLDLGKATVGELDGGRIAAGSLYADRIVSGVSQNMVPDPGFVNPQLNAIRLQRAITYGTTFKIVDGVLSCHPTGETRNNDSNISMGVTSDLYSWPAYPSMKLAVTCLARVTGGTGSFRWTIRMKYRDGSTTFRALIPNTFTPLTGEWVQYPAGLDMPDNVASYSVSFQVSRDSTGVVEMRAPMAAAKTGTVLIEDGAVTGDKVEAVTVTAKVVQSMTAEHKKLVVTESAILQHTTLLGTTVADQLNVRKLLRGRDAILSGTVDVGQLNVTTAMSAEIVKAMDIQARRGIFTEGLTAAEATLLGTTVAENLNAGTVASRIMTGGLLQTTAAANRGVKIDNAGIRAWDDAGQQTIRLNGSDNLVQGTFQTGTTGARILINTVSTTSFMDLYGGGGLDHGTIYYDAGVPGVRDPALTLNAVKDYAADSSSPALRLFPTRGTFGFQGVWSGNTDALKFLTIQHTAGLGPEAYSTVRLPYFTPFPSVAGTIRIPMVSVESAAGADVMATVVSQTLTDITVNVINKSSGKASGTIIVKIVTFVVT